MGSVTLRDEPPAVRPGSPPVVSPSVSRPVGVMQVIDTLDVGGAERVAVSLANRLPPERFTSHLCTTRYEGMLSADVAGHVHRLSLRRRATFDLLALRRLVAYTREHDIRLLHAHGSAVFVATLASLLAPRVSVVWHVHYGRFAVDGHAKLLHRALRLRVAYAIAVSEPLAVWASGRLGFGPDRVAYIPNFSDLTARSSHPPALPGSPGERVICVANFVPEKDHLTLVRAVAMVARERPGIQLLLVGRDENREYARAVRREVEALGLSGNVTLLGQRSDVGFLLCSSDIGVLSSTAEGLPLALVEYGEASLPVVVTDVGQCADVVANGAAGALVPPRSPDALAAALLNLLASPERRAHLGGLLHSRVRAVYNAESVLRQVCSVYERLLQ
jgi:glycosyltransferase involved in cell wall biosynthesis